MNFELLCRDVKVLVEEVAGFIKNEREKNSSNRFMVKGKHDFVTATDKSAELRLVKGLQNILPESGFIAEEGTGSKANKTYNWIIDPIDGTTNFIHGSPPYAISVALIENEEIVIGIVYEVVSSECFYSYKNALAYLNGNPISVSQTSKVSDSLIATGFPYTSYERMAPFMKSLEYFFTQTHGVRRLGSAATDLAYVACGRYDAFYEYNLSAWDVAAGAFLVQQAGGKVGDFHGGKNYIFGKEIVASNGVLFDEFQKKVEQLMNS